MLVIWDFIDLAPERIEILLDQNHSQYISGRTEKFFNFYSGRWSLDAVSWLPGFC